MEFTKSELEETESLDSIEKCDRSFCEKEGFKILEHSQAYYYMWL